MTIVHRMDSAKIDFASDNEKWDAVLRRDTRADGVFWYSVRSTGVYCRPSCPARRPHRDNVRFHPSCADAEAAGFRPCLRCLPQQPSLAQRQAAAVAAACRLIESAEELPSLEQLAAAAGLSPFHFHRVFKAQTGLTPKAYAGAQRSQRLREELQRGASVTDAIYRAGFNSSTPFYASAPATLGMTASDFRAGAPRLRIRFALGECSLGSILVAATDQGVCAISLGDDPQALVHALQDRFQHAELKGGDADFEQLVARVVGLVETPRLGVDLPLDVRGTAFQQRVWQALREIPPGSTLSYSELATRIGEPKAVRAVASACAANPLAIAIPCHRVVRRDGGISGYRWGVERKRALLEREAEGSEAQPADATEQPALHSGPDLP